MKNQDSGFYWKNAISIDLPGGISLGGQGSRKKQWLLFFQKLKSKASRQLTKN